MNNSRKERIRVALELIGGVKHGELVDAHHADEVGADEEVIDRFLWVSDKIDEAIKPLEEILK